MSEHESEVRYLVEEVGVSRRDAELRMVDDDLWVLEPELRFGFEPEEAVAEWGQAAHVLDALSAVAMELIGSGALTQLVLDARARAEEAYLRSVERLEAS